MAAYTTSHTLQALMTVVLLVALLVVSANLQIYNAAAVGHTLTLSDRWLP